MFLRVVKRETLTVAHHNHRNSRNAFIALFSLMPYTEICSLVEAITRVPQLNDFCYEMPY